MADFSTQFRQASATSLLIIFNIIIFLLVELTGGSTNTQHMLRCGACYTDYIVGRKEWYRLFTAMFLHFGLIHLASNMLALYSLGFRLERCLGAPRFLIIYFVGGFAGNLLSLFWEMASKHYAISGGASGAIFAIMGALIFLALCNRGGVADLSSNQIIWMAAFSLYCGFASQGTNNAAHIGGLIGGAAVMSIISMLCPV